MSQKTFDDLVKIMAELRGPNGCPWDKEQTHASLKQYILEEAYEVIETIDEGDDQALKEELGDLMLQSLFQAQIADEHNKFDIYDVIDVLASKLIRRHPNVFGDVEIKSADEQIINWEKIKKKEGKKSAIDGVPKEAPALLRAHRIQQKAATVGFDWDEISQVWDKVHEEIDELEESVKSMNADAVEEEMGDLFFALVNVSRFLNVNSEDALRKSIDKFSVRFKEVEKRFKKMDKSMRESTLEEMDAVWEQVKKDAMK